MAAQELIWVGGASGATGDWATADNWAPISIRSSAWTWTASGSGTNEYYLRTAASGDPGIGEATKVYENGTAMVVGTVGSLAAGEWDWADNDTLGYSTVYVRLTSGGPDPDSLATGYLTFVRIPIAADNVTLQGANAITAGLDQSGVQLGTLVALPTFSGTVGTIKGYLQTDVADGNRFELAGTGLSFIDVGGAAVGPTITNTATASSGAGLYIKGTALTTISFRKGNLEVASGSTVTTINQSYETDSTSDTTLNVPTGVTLTTLNKTGGTATLGVATTTVANDAGKLTTQGTGAITTLTASGGTIYSGSSGTVTNAKARGSGIIDLTRSRTARTVTNADCEGSGKILYDPNVVTLTNAPTGEKNIQIQAA
jgi:hypothetical protein